MPAVSKKQQRYFGYLLSNPEERKKKGISKKAAKDFAQDIQEVSPPGWGHTKAEKEKTKPWKPKSKIGGSAAAFKRALDDGRFKGLPGSKTKKEKTADMFKLMWSMKKKGDHPHYKPGTDKKYKKYQEENVNEAVKGQDTESRKEGAKERASEKRAHDAWKKRPPGTTKRPLYSTTRHTKTVGDDYARQQKQSIKWHDKRTKGKFIPGTTSEDWKPEIEVIDTKKRKKEAEKKRKEAESSLPPHLKLDVMKKAFASESTMPHLKPNDKKAINTRYKGLFKKDLKGTVQGVNEDSDDFRDRMTAVLTRASRERGPEGKKNLAKRIGKRRRQEAELGRLMRHAVASRGQSDIGEGLSFKKFYDTAKKAVRKKQQERKPQMDSTTRKLHKWRTDKEQAEREKYVTFTKPVEDD